MAIGIFKAIGNFVSGSVDLIKDYLREPLKQREHKRNEESFDNTAQRAVEVHKKQKKADTKYRLKEKKHEIILQAKKQTEVTKILAEIEEMQRDKELERMEKATEAIIRYKEELNRLNIDAITAVGSMQIELRQKAFSLIEEKFKKFEAIQDEALHKAEENFLRIESNFGDNEQAKQILMKSVDKMLANVIDSASTLLAELGDDLKSLNNNIDLLTQSSQKFIEDQLSQIKIGSPSTIKRIGKDLNSD